MADGGAIICGHTQTWDCSKASSLRSSLTIALEVELVNSMIRCVKDAWRNLAFERHQELMSLDMLASLECFS